MKLLTQSFNYEYFSINNIVHQLTEEWIAYQDKKKMWGLKTDKKLFNTLKYLTLFKE